MKKVIAFFFSLMVVGMLGICVDAAEFNVKSTTLPYGNAYEEYSERIELADGNDGYTFEYVAGFKPVGITVNSDGTVTGTPKSSGLLKMVVRITHTDGSSADVEVTMIIRPRKVKVNVTAPRNAIYDGVTEYESAVECLNMDGTPLEGASATVRYGADKLEKAVNAGTYTINVYAPLGCTIVERTGDEYMYVAPAEATLSVADKTIEYDGNAHGITAEDVTITPSMVTWRTEYKKDGSSYYTEELPTAPGVYTARTYITDTNYTVTEAYSTIEITIDTAEATKVDFRIDADTTTAVFDRTPHTVTVTPSVDGVTYSVKYETADGTLIDSPINAGEYKVKIEITDDKYYLGVVTNDVLTIEKRKVKFMLDESEIDYDGVAHTPAVTTDWTFNDGEYTISYTKSGITADSVKNAGEYTVTVTFAEDNYEISAESTKTVTVTPMIVGFAVSNNVVDYKDDEYQTATIISSPTIGESEYKVQYVKHGGSTYQSKVKEAGVYDIIITFTNDNYKLPDGFSATMTVKAVINMNMGNSPAAMIYKDTAHKDDTAWQTAALDELKTDKKFTTHIPEGCRDDIVYGDINAMALDTDVNTLIVKDINTFTDPGMTVMDGILVSPIIKGEREAVEGVDGLWKLTYTYGDTVKTRYVIEAGCKIGDINRDGNVNNIDANVIDDTDKAASNVYELRIYDVNKDGRIDGADASAIRRRFREALIPYYPWIQK